LRPAQGAEGSIKDEPVFLNGLAGRSTTGVEATKTKSSRALRQGGAFERTFGWRELRPDGRFTLLGARQTSFNLEREWGSAISAKSSSAGSRPDLKGRFKGARPADRSFLRAMGRCGRSNREGGWGTGTDSAEGGSETGLKRGSAPSTVLNDTFHQIMQEGRRKRDPSTTARFARLPQGPSRGEAPRMPAR